ncbi:hypothetical protein [Alicyclobacillus macrosporangiidus]|uniref:hypothetical protein n=1 Tax=Alicyclobacillus macrosporangiidus TaxID=392015 RepID=UPI001587A9B8|nr:hypothetical protein [Alicyclobacillus macrosporangiidus]
MLSVDQMKADIVRARADAVGVQIGRGAREWVEGHHGRRPPGRACTAAAAFR